MKCSKWMLVLAVVSSIGCGSNEDDAHEQQVEAAAEEVAAAADQVAQEAVAEAAGAAAEATNQAGEATAAANASAMQGLAQLGEALGQALEAGAQAEGGTPCEQSYNGARAMMEALSKQLGSGNEANLPSREAYLEACGRLPEQAQQCMVPSYAMQHMQECREVGNDPQVQRLREMMRGGSAN